VASQLGSKIILQSLMVVLAWLPLCEPILASDPQASDKGDITRVADVLEVRHLQGKKLRVFFSAQENNGIQRFPITTIDRSMIKVEFNNVSAPPADAESLTLNGSGGVELRRALFVGFSLHSKLRGRVIEELRADVADLLRSLPSELLTVAAISQDSARVIADVTPQKSDNINRILQQLQSIEPEGEGAAVADTLCVAAERFHAWDLTSFQKSDQKVLVILSNPGDSPTTERFRGQNCWRSLLDQGVRVFFVSLGETTGKPSFDLSDVAQESGGYVHRVNGTVEMGAAVKNIVALLRNEYVVDVIAPSIAVEDQPLELKLRVSYHDEVFESQAFELGFIIPALAKDLVPSIVGSSLGDSGPDAVGNSPVNWLRPVIFVAVLLISFLIGIFSFKVLRHRLRTVGCNTCARRVVRDHSDCPFRKQGCVGRLVVIGGSNAGQTIPLMLGENRLSRFAFRKGDTCISGRKIDFLHHGSIVIEGGKALYTPRRFGRDRINGWLVNEPRLLGLGSVLKIGDQNLRFEAKS